MILSSMQKSKQKNKIKSEGRPLKVFQTTAYTFSFGGSLLFTLLYLILGVPVVAGVCAFAALLFYISLVLVKRQMLRIAMPLALLSITMIAVLCDFLLGWSLGAHYYLLAGCVLVPASARVSDRTTLIIDGCILVCYFALRHLLLYAEPVYFLSFSVVSFISDLNLLTAFSAIGVSLARYRRALIFVEHGLSRAQARLMRLANTDEVTGTANRRAIHDMLIEVKRSAELSGGRFSVALADLDDFKAVNDNYGHDCGDAVLREVCRRSATVLRKSDAMGRWGGEEFLLVLPRTGMEEAAEVAERLRQNICESPVEYQGQSVTVSTTIGVAEFQPGEDDSSLIARADRFLYEGKRSGKNRVVAEVLSFIG